MEVMFSSAAAQGHEELFHEVCGFGAGVIFLSCLITRLARWGLGQSRGFSLLQ